MPNISDVLHMDAIAYELDFITEPLERLAAVQQLAGYDYFTSLGRSPRTWDANLRDAQLAQLLDDSAA